MKFRLEINCQQIKEKVMSTQRVEQGLKAPKMHFVTKEAYEAEFGEPPAESDLVYETFQGQLLQGVSWQVAQTPRCLLVFCFCQVNIQTGKAGWYQRVSKDTGSVDRVAQLNDAHCIDKTGAAMDKLHNMAKKGLLKKHIPAATMEELCEGAPQARVNLSSNLLLHGIFSFSLYYTVYPHLKLKT